MNKMIKAGILALLAAGCSTLAYAQESPPPSAPPTEVSTLPPLPAIARYQVRPVMLSVTYTPGPDRFFGDIVKAPAAQTVSMTVASLPANLSKLITTPYVSSCALVATSSGGQKEKEKIHSEVETGLRMELTLLNSAHLPTDSLPVSAEVQFRISLSGLSVTPPKTSDQCVDLLTVGHITASGVVAVPFEGSVEHLMGDAGKLTFTARR
jgi:hypothetical protein